MAEDSKNVYTDESDSSLESFAYNSFNGKDIDESIIDDSYADSNDSETNDKRKSSSRRSTVNRNSINPVQPINKNLNTPYTSKVKESDKENSINAHNLSGAMRTPKPVISSDSEEDDPTPRFSSKKNNPKTNILSQSRKSVSSKPEFSEDSTSDEENFIKERKPLRLILSDSDDEIEIHSFKEPTIVIDSERSDDEENKTEHAKKNDVLNTPTKLDSTRFSEEFKSTALRNSLNSTRIDAIDERLTDNAGVSPHPKVKRLLERSIDTPRIIKQIKESNTPARDAFSPRHNTTVIENSSDDDEDSDVIDVSSGDDAPVKPTPSKSNKNLRQPTLDTLLKPAANSGQGANAPTASPRIQVSRQVYQQQESKVKQFQSDIQKAANVLRTVNLDLLPDKGVSIKLKHQALERALVQEVKKFSKMAISEGDKISSFHNKPGDGKNSNVKVLTWEQLEANAAIVQPKTFGKQALSTYNAQKAVTMDRLQQLHGSLKDCPKETDYADDPKGLKVQLMPHQKHALAWLTWREKQKPSGGILADDMGLGKTLTMISLVLKTKETNTDSDESDTEKTPARSSKPKGGTLVICPASLINQWSGECERRTKRGLASWEVYHGPKRETNAKRLAQHDMVFTTYAIANNESEKNGTIYRVRWRRIILDEAHQIRNYKSQTSVAVCKLSAKSRWSLTGTPVQNKELDMYALLKFLRCTPFDDLNVWKRWVGDKSTGGQERLHTVISSLMLRRTKVELIEKGSMLVLPERKWELIPVTLTKNEFDVYNRILIFSRTLFAQFLHQRAEKRQDAVDYKYSSQGLPNEGPNKEYFMMREKLLKLNKVKDVKQHEILVLLLRLRQICCHPSLITGMLHEDMENLGDEDDGSDFEKHEELDLLDQLNKLALNEDHHPEAHEAPEEEAGLKEAAKGWLNPKSPIFSKERMSSKIEAMLEVMKKKVIPTKDKAIIVSQWPSFLHLIASHLKRNNVVYDQLDGKVPVSKRMDMVDTFNDPKSKLKVLLLSLTAGGVGLNLVGGNHLFLLDLHWNPQLENQAQDRIYRVGQEKPVFVYKFMATDTIEKRILDLQEKKLQIADSMLTGSKVNVTNKLTLQDLKMLFEM